MKVEKVKKSQRKTTLEIENLGKKSGIIDESITNRIQEIEERISGAEDSIENINTTVKDNAKCKTKQNKTTTTTTTKLLTQNIQEIQEKMRRPHLRIIGIE